MAVLSWLLLAMALVSVLGQSNRSVSQADINTILSLHNSVRSGIAPVATDMFRVTWDNDLANSAQDYANTCPTAHSGRANVGENLSWGWPTMTAADAVKEWVNEAPSYSFGSNTCAAGKVCAHYTQMIWSNSAKIGCGVRSCPNLLGQAVADAWVCHYTVAGNIVGSKPYTAGTASCSACPSNTVCMENLCTIPGTASTPAAAGTPSAPTSPPSSSPAAPASPGTTPALAGATPALAGATPALAGPTPALAGATPAAGFRMPSSASTGAIPAAGFGIPSSTGAALPTLSAGAMPGVAAPQLSPSLTLAPGVASTPAASPAILRPNLGSAPTPIPIGVINDDPSLLGSPLSPFTIVQSKNKTAIAIAEYSPINSNTTVPNITDKGNGTLTIMGFPQRTFFG